MERMQTYHSQQSFTRIKFKYLIISLRLVIKLFISGVSVGAFINLFILRKPNAIPICCNCCKKLNPNRSNSIMINRFSIHTICKDILYLQCWSGGRLGQKWGFYHILGKYANISLKLHVLCRNITPLQHFFAPEIEVRGNIFDSYYAV